MALDFIKFINDNWSATLAKKVALLDDFCSHFDYQGQILDEEGKLIPNPESKKDFANGRIAGFIKEAVNSHRREMAEQILEYDKLEF